MCILRLYMVFLAVLNSIMVPKDIQVLIPKTCECYLIWEKRLCRCNKIKDLEMGSALNAITSQKRLWPEHLGGSVQLLVSTQVMNSWLWDRAPYQAPLWGWSLFGILSLLSPCPLPITSCCSYSLIKKIKNKTKSC